MLDINFSEITKDLNRKIKAEETFALKGKELVKMDYQEFQNAIHLSVYTKESLTKALDFLCQDLMQYVE